jgi:hypothetical protein
MATQTLERTAMTRLRNMFPDGDDRTARAARLPLRSALYLIAHEDESGRAHLGQDRLSLGLAGAVLLDLWLARRISIGWRYDARQGVSVKVPGLVSVHAATPIGDPLSDNLLTTLWNSGGGQRLRDVLERFAATNLYERVRADMIAAGVLHRVSWRRYWFLRGEAYQPTHRAYPARARAAIRDLVDSFRENTDEQLNPHVLALSALVSSLGLSRYVYGPDDDGSTFQQRLGYLADQQTGPTIRDVVAAAIGR